MNNNVSDLAAKVDGHVLLDMGDFLLLLRVRLHLVDFVLLLCLNVRGIITGIVSEFLLQREVHDVRAYGIHEILGVGGDDEYVIIGGKVGFKPNDSAEIQMIGRFIEEK